MADNVKSQRGIIGIMLVERGGGHFYKSGRVLSRVIQVVKASTVNVTSDALGESQGSDDFSIFERS